MSLPYFFVPQLHQGNLILEEDTSKHIVQVLRMKQGVKIELTDGRGRRGEALIIDDHRKACKVQVLGLHQDRAHKPHITIAVSLLKNSSRLEWFLEKAAEIGINTIIPMICERTEREKFRMERLQHILIAAMIQSQQSFLTELKEPTNFKEVVASYNPLNKFIAHCEKDEKVFLPAAVKEDAILLIGPEGDFSPGEIKEALHAQYTPVSLGETRLRTETAALAGSMLLRLT